MTGTNWVEVGGIAQLCAAGATVFLAGVTAVMAKRTHTLADETRDLAGEARQQVAVAQLAAEAAQQEAQATEALAVEQRIDRQLQWRPQVEVEAYEIPELDPAGADYNGPPVFRFAIGNNGAGPALSVVVAARLMENVGVSVLVRLGDLRPNAEPRQAEVPAHIGGPSLTSPFDSPLPGLTDRYVPILVVFCRDVLGRQWRFAYSQPVDSPPNQDVEIKRHPGEVAGDPLPRWAEEPLIWE